MGISAPEERPRYLKEFLEWAAKIRYVAKRKEKSLSPSERLVLCALFAHLGQNDSCWPEERTLAGYSGLKVRQIRNLIKKLVSIGVIERYKRRTTGRTRGNNAYEYRFVFAQADQTKAATDCPFDETKAAISDQTKAAICDIPKRQSVTPKAAKSDTQSGNLRHAKVPEKQARRGLAGAEYIKNISENKSVNQSAKNDGLNDGLNDVKNSDKKPASEEVVSLAWDDPDSLLGEEVDAGFAPPPGAPGAPPRLAPEQINALFGGPGPRPVNLLNCPVGDFALRDLTSPFKKGPGAMKVLGFDPDTPRAEWFEDALKEFYREVINRHWNPNADHPPGAPFRRLLYRAGRSGLLYEFGFRPLSPEQQEERRREVERQEEEAAEAARLREEERRRLAEKEAEYKAFIKRRVVQNYLSCMGIPPRDYKNHLREIAARLNGRATLNAVEQFMRAKLQNEGH